MTVRLPPRPSSWPRFSGSAGRGGGGRGGSDAYFVGNASGHRPRPQVLGELSLNNRSDEPNGGVRCLASLPPLLLCMLYACIMLQSKRAPKRRSHRGPQDQNRKEKKKNEAWCPGVLSGKCRKTYERLIHRQLKRPGFPFFFCPKAWKDRKMATFRNASESQKPQKTLRFPRFRAFRFWDIFWRGPETPIFIAFRDLLARGIFSNKTGGQEKWLIKTENFVNFFAGSAGRTRFAGTPRG